METENGRFSGRQLRVIVACFLAYFCAYIGRLNMSATLGHVIEAMKVDETLGGTLQTVFAIVYASGQFIFGAMVDRVRPRILLSVGLIGSALCNLAFSFSGAFGLMIAMWALNGLFQSMLWTPIVRTLAENFEGRKRMKASFVMSFTLACGHIAAWGLSSLLSMYVVWRNAYRVPAAILFTACVGTNLILPGDAGNAIGAAKAASKSTVGGKMSIAGMLQTGLVLLFVGCVANGFIRDGVTTWAPTIIGGKKSLFSLIIPVINMVGILIGVVFLKKGFSLGRSYRQGKLEGFAITGINVALLVGLVAFPALLLFSESGPGSMRAPIWAALAAGLIVGAIAQRTRLCMVGGIRDVILFKDWTLICGFIAIIVIAAIGNIATGNFHLGFTRGLNEAGEIIAQPVAHTEHLWNFLGMTVVGLGSVLLGGCPLRQLILAGEGNTDSAVAVLGMFVGAAFCHNFKLASSGAGTTPNGRIACILMLVVMLVIAVYNTKKSKA